MANLVLVEKRAQQRIYRINPEAMLEVDLDGMLQTGMEGGANESWDRMEELLVELQVDKR